MSRWLELARTCEIPTLPCADSAESADSPPTGTNGAIGTGERSRTVSRSELLRAAGDAAEAINAHCETCPTCRPEAFVGEVLTFPTCPEGLELRRRYREARRRALAGVAR